MREKVKFKSVDGLKLVGVYSLPKGKPPFPTVVAVHGYDSSKDSDRYTVLEKMLLPLGIAVFRFDYRGHGESEGSWKDITFKGVASDVRSAIDYLCKNYSENLDKNKLILRGGSFSALPIVMAAGEDKRVKYLICVSGMIDGVKRMRRFYDLNKWKQQGWIEYRFGAKNPRLNKLNYGLIEEGMKFDLKKMIKKVKVPSLVMHGTKDKEVLPYNSQFLFDNLGSKDKTLKLIKGADHGYTGKRKEMQQTIVEWIKTKSKKRKI